jgi:protein-tyrosine-phosphatase
MKLLFVCKYNAFRSRIAEEYFRKINKNPKIKAISRGLIMQSPSDNVQRKTAGKLLGINIANRNPLPLSIKNLKEADLIIVVANDVPKVIFDYKKGSLYRKLVIWKIKDEQMRNKKNIKRIVLAIKKKIEKLERRLR